MKETNLKNSNNLYLKKDKTIKLYRDKSYDDYKIIIIKIIIIIIIMHIIKKKNNNKPKIIYKNTKYLTTKYK